jgi:hypothetical protein
MTIRIPRRSLLGASAFASASSLVSVSALTSASPSTLGVARSSSASTTVRSAADLFVFRSSDNSNLVFAVLSPESVASSVSPARFDVSIHAGPKSWTESSVRSLQTGAITERRHSRIFAGEVVGPSAISAVRHTAIVVESPPDLVPAGEVLDVWAEVRNEDGTRFRVGNPFLGGILARDPALSSAYHATSSAEDRTLFTRLLVSRLVTLGTASGIANSHEHARRLAARMLPDVIHYRPDLPVGFNFASQNGRHPADDTATVVQTILTGSVARRPTSRPIRLTANFPYFPQPIAA